MKQIKIFLYSTNGFGGPAQPHQDQVRYPNSYFVTVTNQNDYDEELKGFIKESYRNTSVN
jgi:hypothetical protein